MSTVFRADYGTLGKAETTPQGGIRVAAAITRSGVLSYVQPDGTVVKEYRPATEVFSKDSKASLRDAPVTLDHPPENLKPRNFKKYTAGHLAGDVSEDGNKLAATLCVQDSAAIEAIEGGWRDVSCGYHCDVDETPGVTADGEQYDRVQRNIRYNHVAIVQHGRAGKEVGLRLDSAGNQTQGDRMNEKIEIIGGVEHTVGTPAHKDAVTRRDTATNEGLAKIADLEAKLLAEKTRADSAEKNLVAVKERARELLSPKSLDRAVAQRTAVIARAKQLAPELKTDGLTNAEIRSAVVKAARPEIRLDGRDAEFVKGVFRTLEQSGTAKKSDMKVGERTDGKAPIVVELPAAVKSADDVRADAIKQSEDRSKGPLAYSKNKPAK